MARRVSRTVSFSRPANTTAYTALDGVSEDATTPTGMTFTDVVPSGGFGALIRSARLHKTDQDTTNAAFDLYLFTAMPAVAGFNDNAAIAITDAEWLTCVGRISFAQADAQSVATGDEWNYNNLNLAFSAASGTTNIFGVMVARGAYTPASGETFSVTLGVEID